MPVDLLIRGGTLVTQEAVTEADIAIEDGTIVAVGDLHDTARDEINATGLHIFAGLIDSHVHFNEPGRTHWEGIATGSAALAVGGGTTFIDMPLNSSPPVLTSEAFDAKADVGQAKSRCDFALWGGLTPTNLDHLATLADRGVVGFKAFMCGSGIDDFLAVNDESLYTGMTTAAQLGLPVAVHAESQTITAAHTKLAQGRNDHSWQAWTVSRPVIAEVEAIQRALAFAEDTGCALHIVHVSSARAAQLVHQTKQQQHLDVTCETCPHYLALTADDLPDLGARAKCAPPLRDEANQADLWDELLAGTFDVVGSDHSPAPPDMKSDDDAFAAWGGIAGVQSTLSLLLSHTPEPPLPLLTRLTATNPAQRFRLPRKGQLAPGHDADLTLVDLSENFALTRDMLHDRHRLNPYTGRTLTGRPVRTLLRGQTTALDGQPVGKPLGKLLTPEA
ncbi:MAG: allantoinase AllB [Planctomycetota bacterium]